MMAWMAQDHPIFTESIRRIRAALGETGLPPLLCTSRSSTCCCSGSKPVSPSAARIRRMLSVKIGWSWAIHAIIDPCRSICSGVMTPLRGTGP